MDAYTGSFNANDEGCRSAEDSTMIWAGDQLALDLAELYRELWLIERGYKSKLTMAIITAEIEKMLAEYLQHRRKFAENDSEGLLNPEEIDGGLGRGLIVSTIEADVAHAKRRKMGELH